MKLGKLVWGAMGMVFLFSYFSIAKQKYTQLEVWSDPNPR